MKAAFRFACCARTSAVAFLTVISLALGSCGGGSGDNSNDSIQNLTRSHILATGNINDANALSVVSISKVSETRITRTVFEYGYTITVKGASYSLDGASAVLSATAQGTTVINGKVNIGSVEANALVTPLEIIRIRHDRTFPFNLNAMNWAFFGTKPVAVIIPMEGGTLEVADSKSPINKTKISIPSLALQNPVEISIRYSDLNQLDIQQDKTLVAVSKKISINRNDNQKSFGTFVELTLPYSSSTNATPFVWTRENESDQFRLVVAKKIDYVNQTITVRTTHFSEWIVTISNYFENSIKPLISTPTNLALNISSGFDPLTDGFFIKNPNGIGNINTGGSCFGISAFSSYYYSAAKSVEQIGLAQRFKQKGKLFDHLDIDPADDVIATELAGRAHRLISQHFKEYSENLEDLDKYSEFEQVIYALSIKQPVILHLNGGDGKAAHAVTIYSYNGTQFTGKFSIYDNNFPSSDPPSASGYPAATTIEWSRTNGFSNYTLLPAYAGSLAAPIKYYIYSDAAIIQKSPFGVLLSQAKSSFAAGSVLGSIAELNSESFILKSTGNSSVDELTPSIFVDISNTVLNQSLDNIINPRLIISGEGFADKEVPLVRNGNVFSASAATTFGNWPAGNTPIFLKLVASNGSNLLGLHAWGVANLVKVAPPPPNFTLRLDDTFDGSSLNANSWTGVSGILGFSVANSSVQFNRAAYAHTNGKVTFDGGKIVIESRFGGLTNNGRDTNIALVDTVTGDRIHTGDTNYQGQGFYVYATGAYGLGQQSTGSASTNAYLEYRITLEGKTLTLERGPSLSNLTFKKVYTLGQSSIGRRYYLQIGTGGGIEYSPGTFDWIRVDDSPPAISNWCGQSLDFTANTNATPPPGWAANLIRTGPGITGGQLRGSATNGGIMLDSSAITLPFDVKSIVVEYDSSRSASGSGQFNNVEFRTSAGLRWRFDDVNFSAIGAGNRSFRSGLYSVPFFSNVSGSTTNYVEQIVPMGSGLFKTRLTVRDGNVEWVETNLGTNSSTTVSRALPSFTIASLVGAGITAYETDGGGTWIDNVKIQCLR